ncbi:MAG: diguanylate cyclase [Rhodospirillales bacterium]|nr:diguanylate cyclase [Rhodospirillales bacterium]
MARQMTLRQASALISAALLLVALLVAGVVFLMDRNVDHVSDAWVEFQTKNSEKIRLVNTIRGSMGYGGLIHNFKNLILTGDNEHADLAFGNLGALKTTMAQYASLEVTSAERIALSHIRDMLANYSKALDLAQKMIFRGASASEIDTAVKVDDSYATRALDALHTESLASLNVQRDHLSKVDLVGQMRAVLGYGGMIHAFKNYVIRQSDNYAEQTIATLQDANDIIERYSSNTTTHAEELALTDLEKILDTYFQNLGIAQELVTKTMAPSDIHQTLQIDDNIALRALATLDRENIREIELQALEVTDVLNETEQLGKTVAGATAALIAAIILLVFWLFRSQIIQPLTRLSDTMAALAKGDLDVTVSGADANNEIGGMARAVSVFKENAERRALAERTLVDVNDQLNIQITAMDDLRARSDEEAAKAIGMAEDLSIAQDEAETALRMTRDNEEKVRSILQAVHDAIITIDTNATIETFNPGAEKLFGYKAEDVIGENVKILTPEDIRVDHDDFVRRLVTGGQPRLLNTVRELTAVRKDGSEFPIELSITRADIHEDVKFTGVVRDITERKKAEEEIRKMAMTDSLTGLANRNMFHRRLEEGIQLAKRQDQLLGLAMIDLDKFKPVNDTYGHPAGDALLVHVAEVLMELSRDTDTVVRLGGDEFAIILTNPETVDAVGLPADRIITALRTPVDIEGNKIQIGASIGISFYPHDGTVSEDLIKAADLALYNAKESGRNCYRIFDPETMRAAS